ncbi:MAG: pyridoxamine 5'-phosphate oxidase [Gemmatimonadetes bacterium]|nr:pyridoxamine 5'-phosphate oxidase [Gemmatimonadota bacterium]
MDPDALRREYVFGSLDEQDLNADPFKQFDTWFGNAVDAGIELADVMTVATASQAGVPSARIVVLRGVDERGFVFYTDYRSAKSRDLDENPRAALVFYWRELGRQVRISGAVHRVSAQESARYFQSRPLESRIAALASSQTEVIADRKVLEDRFEALRAEYPSGDIPCPDNWGGYRVTPDEFEFWQGRELRLHDRIRYRRGEDGLWVIERLSP